MSVTVARQIAAWQENQQRLAWDANPKEFGVIDFCPADMAAVRFPFYELPADATFLGLMGADALCLMDDCSLRVFDHEAAGRTQPPPAPNQQELVPILSKYDRRPMSQKDWLVLLAVSSWLFVLYSSQIFFFNSYTQIAAWGLISGIVVALAILFEFRRPSWKDWLVLIPVSWWLSVLGSSQIFSDFYSYTRLAAWGLTAGTVVALAILCYAIRGWWFILVIPLAVALIFDISLLWIWNA